MIINAHTTLEETKQGYYAVVQAVNGTTHRIRVNLEDVIAYKSGELIQQAMPYLSANERELIISGVPGDLYDRMFNDDDRI